MCIYNLGIYNEHEYQKLYIYTSIANIVDTVIMTILSQYIPAKILRITLELLKYSCSSL